MKEDILGYLFDALEREEEGQIERKMEADPQFRAQVEALRRLTQPLAEDDCIEPPAGLAARTLKHVRVASAPKVAREGREWGPARTAMRPLDFAVASCLLTIAAVLVLPAIACIRGDHARVLCTDQLRRLGVALASYSAVEGGFLPYVESEGPQSFAGVFAIQLKARDLIPNEQILVCPSANSSLVKVPTAEEFLKAQENPVTAQRQKKYMAGSYGYALGFRQNGAHIGLSSKLDSTQPILSDRPPRADEITFINSPNHQGSGQNVLCAGGNVRWLPYRVFGNDDLFRNDACQVAAGVGLRDTVIGVSEASPYPSRGL